MKYLTEDIMDFKSGSDVYREEVITARELYRTEYNKTRKKLPKKFVKIYEENEGFNDFKVPIISFLTEYIYSSYGMIGSKPSNLKLIFIKYDNIGLAWDITIKEIIKYTCNYSADNPKGDIEDFIYDGFLLEQNGFISWEMQFSSGFNIRVIFKKLDIRRLDKDEASKYTSIKRNK